MMTPRDRQILRIAVPSIVSNITVPLLGLVDVAITGHLGAASYIGAIAVGGMLFNVIYWLFAFLRMGTSGLTSQALGRRDLGFAVRQLRRSLCVALAIAGALLVLQVPVRELGLLVMAPSAEVRRLTTAYFSICVWGAPATLGLFALSGWFVGMQNSRSPMVVAVVQNVVNIVVSLVLVFGAGMKVEGVATGTLVAQWVGFLLAGGLCVRYYGRLFRHLHDAPGRGTPAVTPPAGTKKAGRGASGPSLFRVNGDIFLRTLCLVSVLLFFTAAGSRQGEVVLAVNTLLMQLYLLVSYVMDGFANAAEAMSGRYFGARHAEALADTVRRCFRWGWLCAGGFTILYIAGGDAFLRLLTDEPSVVAASHGYVVWAWLVPLVSTAAFIWDGVFIGLTASRQMLQSSAVATLLFFAAYFLLRAPLGNHGLWLAYLLFLGARGAVQTLLVRTRGLLRV